MRTRYPRHVCAVSGRVFSHVLSFVKNERCPIPRGGDNRRLANNGNRLMTAGSTLRQSTGRIRALDSEGQRQVLYRQRGTETRVQVVYCSNSRGRCVALFAKSRELREAQFAPTTFVLFALIGILARIDLLLYPTEIQALLGKDKAALSYTP